MIFSPKINRTSSSEVPGSASRPGALATTFPSAAVLTCHLDRKKTVQPISKYIKIYQTAVLLLDFSCFFWMFGWSRCFHDELMMNSWLNDMLIQLLKWRKCAFHKSGTSALISPMRIHDGVCTWVPDGTRIQICNHCLNFHMCYKHWIQLPLGSCIMFHHVASFMHVKIPCPHSIFVSEECPHLCPPLSRGSIRMPDRRQLPQRLSQFGRASGDLAGLGQCQGQKCEVLHFVLWWWRWRWERARMKRQKKGDHKKLQLNKCNFYIICFVMFLSGLSVFLRFFNGRFR